MLHHPQKPSSPGRVVGQHRAYYLSAAVVETISDEASCSHVFSVFIGLYNRNTLPLDTVTVHMQAGRHERWEDANALSGHGYVHVRCLCMPVKAYSGPDIP